MIKMKKIPDESLDFHPNDLADGSCGGFDLFCSQYPRFRAWFRENKARLSGKKNKGVYDEFKTHPELLDPEYTIQPVEAERLGAVLLAKAEFCFQNIALLAQKGLNTRQEEERLLHLKEAIQCLSQYKNNCVAYVSPTQKITESIPFGTLRQLPEKIREYIKTDEGQIIGCVPVPHHSDEGLYILVPAVEDAAPPLKLGFDGKNFIAVYTQNVPKLPESVNKMLSLPPAQAQG